MEELLFKCPYAEKCGGCQLTKCSYREQLALKQEQMQELLSPFCRVLPILPMEEPYHYRCKSHAVLSFVGRGRVIFGVYRKGTHDVVPVEHCLIENEKADAVIGKVRELIQSFRIPIYDEDRKTGILRHILVRTGLRIDEMLLVLVSASENIPRKRDFVAAILKNCPDVDTVVLNINDKKTSMVLGTKDIVLAGKGAIEDVICGLNFRISAQSFYQVNPVQAEKLYETAIAYAGLSGKETLLDAYCGVGTLGLIAAKHCKSVIGVELNPAAVRDAAVNAKRNGIKNARFLRGDAGHFLSTLQEPLDVVLMDPPRSGASEEFLSALCAHQPSRIVYVSCGPDTLARDLKFLTAHGYRAEKAQPVDLFPWTGHVETVVLLSQLRQKPDDYIDVDVDVAELEGTSAETKATYEKIKKYVAEHNDGMKVSSLYIAQVKKKCGIELAENFNLPKSEDSRQPQCPKEKEEAIMEALRHYRMI